VRASRRRDHAGSGRTSRKPLRVESVGRAGSRISASAFHRHFKAVTALSPLQYQKTDPAHACRSLLIAGEGNTTAIAFDVGYESATQFSREYSRFVGMPPSMSPTWRLARATRAAN
jgi:methylphosphotriester-DNA--protein-cysteine methyltransferase